MSFIEHNDAIPLQKILVVGVGGGGSNVVARMIADWSEGPEAAVVNTDVKALKACEVPQRIQIGRNITKGLGAGGDVSVGKLAAEDDIDRLRNLVAHTHLVIIIATLGGGTGTGAAPILARVAREEGALTLCFVSTPFEFEGERRAEYAREGFRALKMEADAVVCLPNQHLLEMVPDKTSLVSTFETSDQMIGTGIQSLWRLLTQNGMINLDFADLRNLVEHSGGSCSFGYGEGEGAEKSAQALHHITQGPLLDHGNALTQSEALLISIQGGMDLTLMDIQTIMNHLKSITRPDARLAMGATINPDWKGRLALTILAADNWDETPATAAVAELPEVPVSKPTSKEKEPELITEAPKEPKGAKKKVSQATLDFESTEKGRMFSKVEPTLYNGEDLDIPTFIRRGIKISIDK
jgi:cell division protein FtsZ